MIRRAVKLLGSIRLTLVLILSLSFLFLLGLWIPQKAVLQRDLYEQWQKQVPRLVSVLDTLELTSIYTSPVTLAFWFLFFLNLALVMGQRIPVVMSRVRLQPPVVDDLATASIYPQKAAIPMLSHPEMDPIAAILRRAGYSVTIAAGQLCAVKNRLSPVATILFHFSFLLILLGGVISLYTRFTATVDLAEGEVFHGKMEQYNPYPSVPKIGSPPQADFTVDSIEPLMEQGTHTGINIAITDKRGVRHQVGVNRPYVTDQTSFVIRTLGIAPLVVLYDGKNRELDGAYVKLNILEGKQDTFAMADLQFVVKFFPDHYSLYGVEKTRSDEMKNPAFLLDVRKGGRSLGRHVVRLGESVPFANYRVEIKEIPFWIRFYVVKERGLPILYTGFAIATIALIWRLIYYRRDIVGVVKRREGKDMLLLAGRGEFYPVLFGDEFQRLTANIRSLLTGA